MKIKKKKKKKEQHNKFPFSLYNFVSHAKFSLFYNYFRYKLHFNLKNFNITAYYKTFDTFIKLAKILQGHEQQ